jgi:hypothetical protein
MASALQQVEELRDDVMQVKELLRALMPECRFPMSSATRSCVRTACERLGYGISFHVKLPQPSWEEQGGECLGRAVACADACTCDTSVGWLTCSRWPSPWHMQGCPCPLPPPPKTTHIHLCTLSPAQRLEKSPLLPLLYCDYCRSGSRGLARQE